MSAALRYEWRRISSIRSTWILIAIAVALSSGLALLFSFLLGSTADGDSDGAEITLDAGLIPVSAQVAANLLVLVVVSTIAAQAIGQDYRHGTIRVTLTEFPNRTVVFSSKIIIALAVITVAFVLSLVAAAIVLGVGGNTTGNGDDPLGSIVRTWLYALGFCAIAFALTAITRILALGVVIPLVVAAVLEPLASSLLTNYVSWLPDALPFTAGLNFANGTDALRAGLVFGGWTFAALAVAYVMFTRRDA